MRGHHPDVAGRRKFKSTAKGMAVQNRNGWLGQARKPVKNPVSIAHPEPREIRRAEIAPSIDIRSGTKRPITLGSQHHSADARVTLDLVQMCRHIGQHLGIKGIHLGRVVQTQLGQTPIPYEVNRAHDPHPIGASASSDKGMIVASSATLTRPSDAAMMSLSASMPGMISVATRPFSPNRMTQRSVT